MEKKDEGRALEIMIEPLINALAPGIIKEPKTRVGRLVRSLIREHLGDALYTSILDRFIIAACEKDPDEAFYKLEELNEALSNIVYELEEAKEGGWDRHS